MPYAQRNGAGSIIGLYGAPQPGTAEEFLADSNAEVVAHLAPKFSPAVISDRQFFQQLAVLGVVTQDEAIAAVATGTLPASMDALVGQLPSGDRFAANMLLKGATQFDRTHPMVAAFGSAFGWTSQQIDALWTEAFLL